MWFLHKADLNKWLSGAKVKIASKKTILYLNSRHSNFNYKCRQNSNDAYKYNGCMKTK